MDDWQQDWANSMWEPPKDDKKCECGCTITYGDNCPPEYHSDWCPKSTKPKKKSESK